MPVHKVQAPNGQIIKVEAPENASPEQVTQFAMEKYAQDRRARESKEYSSGDVFVSSAMRAFPFGTDIAAAGAGALQALTTDMPYSEARDRAKSELMRASGLGAEQFADQPFYKNPQVGGMLTGGIAGGAMVPAKALQGGSVFTRGVKGGALGGGLAFGYGAQEGDTINERIGSGLQEVPTGAAFGAGGSVATDLAGMALRPVGRAISETAETVKNRFTQPRQAAQAASDAGEQTGRNITETATGQVGIMQRGGVLPLTKGQSLQAQQGQGAAAQRAQSLEFGSQSGIYGDEAQRLAESARVIQDDAALDAITRAGGREISEEVRFKTAENILSNLKAAYQSAKNKTQKYYGALRDASDDPVRISANYIKETIIPDIKQWKRGTGMGSGFDLKAEGMTDAKRLFDEVMFIGDMKKVSALNLQRMEKWRGRVSQAISSSKDPASRAFLSGMLARYDAAMDRLPREALKSGDDAVFSLLKKARGARAQQGRLFERDKLVADILQKENITTEEFSNLLFGKGKTFNKDAANRIDAILSATKKPEIINDVRAGLYSNILKNSLDSEMQGGKRMISFDKLATNLNELVNENPTLFKKLHPDLEQQEFVKKLLQDVNLIKSVKTGSKNYSNSAYTILNNLRQFSPVISKANIPAVGSLGGAAEQAGREIATTELRESLQDVLMGTMDDLKGSAFNAVEKYGRGVLVGGGATIPQINNTITITPAPKDQRYPDVVSDDFIEVAPGEWRRK